MGMFDAEKGLCHLVFANEDNYYIKSLMRLNLRQYLYFNLKQKGIQTVYFVGGDEGQYELSISDAASASSYERYEKQKFFDLFKAREADGGDFGKIVKIYDIRSFLLRMITMMKKEKKQAFVFYIEVFCQMKTCPDIIDMLCQISDKNYNKGNLLLIVAPVVSEGSRPYFADASGIFRSDLFPEIQQIFKLHKSIHIYEKIKDELGERVVFLNTLERDSIYWMLLHKLVEETPYMDGYFSKAADLADFIWAWYHSEAVRCSAGAVLPQNEKRMLSEIEKALDNKAALERINIIVEQMRREAGGAEPLKQWLCRNYGEDLQPCLIYEDNALLRKLEQIPIDSIFSQERDFSTEFIHDSLNHIRAELRKPGLISGETQLPAYAGQCVEYMQHACFRGDRTTLEKAVAALKFCICEAYTADLQDDSELGEDGMVPEWSARWDLYMKTIQVSRQLCEITELYQQDGRRLEEYRKNLSLCLRDIKSYEKENAQVIVEQEKLSCRNGNTPISAQLQHLMAKKTEAVSLSNDIKGLEHLRATKLTLMNSCKDNIQKMEMAISSIAAGNVYNLKENLDYAASLVMRVTAENSQVQKEISEASMNVQYTFEEMAIMNGDYQIMSERDIDREFKDLLQDPILNEMI